MISQNDIALVVLLTISFLNRIDCNDNKLDFDFNTINEKLPPGIRIPSLLQNITLPSFDDFKKVMQEKCTKVSGREAAYEAIEAGTTELKECTSGLMDVDELQNEIKQATIRGELDSVFKEYCNKRDIVIDCMENFTAILEPCLESKEIDGQRTLMKMFHKLLEFFCYKGGIHIALIIAEKGPECFIQRKNELMTCINTTFHGHLPSDATDITTVPNILPEFVMGIEQCDAMDTLQVCVVKTLETCAEVTPANLIESMFRYIRSDTLCANATPIPFNQLILSIFSLLLIIAVEQTLY